MDFDLQRTKEVLRATPGALRALLEGLDDAWVTADEGPDTFSPYDIVGHLLHGERTDWMERLAIILEHGEARPFTPFDRFAMRRRDAGKPLRGLLDEFASAREANLEKLEQLDLGPDRLELTGTHPELGRVTARQLLSTWAVHDLGHIAQAARVMARAYSGQVGPWRDYLPILTR